MRRDIFLYLFIFVAVLAISGCSQNAIKACTQEAKLCPDGSTVGRHGPSCEFDPCPNATAVTPPVLNDIPDYISCNSDDDCACGVSPSTGDCLIGNKNFVDTSRQCPDFCTGIDGRMTTQCVENKCRAVHI